jgi:hypothetical protein
MVEIVVKTILCRLTGNGKIDSTADYKPLKRDAPNGFWRSSVGIRSIDHANLS